jgi:hypothetical protein
MYQLFIVIGIALSFWVNYGFLNMYGENPDAVAMWRVPFALQFIPGILLVATIVFEKESPRWLCEKGRFDEAKAVIARLARKPIDHPDVTNEVDDIRLDLESRIKLTAAQQFREIFSSRKMFYRCSLPVIM